MITGATFAATAAILADGDDDFGAGFIAFVVVIALCVASYFLFRSMNKHLKGLPAHFPPPRPGEDAAGSVPPMAPTPPTSPTPPGPPAPPRAQER
jgi:hypothetical protein